MTNKTQLGVLQKYKHDTIGKFVIIKELIESLDENNLEDESSKEILYELQSTFEKMATHTKLLIEKKS